MSGSFNLSSCPLVSLIGQENAGMPTNQIVQALVANFSPQTAVGDSAVFNVSWPATGNLGPRICAAVNYRKVYFVLLAQETVDQVGLLLIQLNQVTPTRDVFYTLLALQSTTAGVKNHALEGPCCHFGDGASSSKVLMLPRSALRSYAHPSRDGFVSRVAVRIGNLTTSRTSTPSTRMELHQVCSSASSCGSLGSSSPTPAAYDSSSAPPMGVGVLQQSMPNTLYHSSSTFQSPPGRSTDTLKAPTRQSLKSGSSLTSSTGGPRHGAVKRSQYEHGLTSASSSNSALLDSSTNSSVFEVPSTETCMKLLNFSSSSGESSYKSNISPSLRFIFKN